MPLIRRHEDYVIKTITPAEMVAVLDADTTRPAYVGSNARFNALTGALIYQHADGQLVGCDITSDANYEEALAIAHVERQQLKKKSPPAPGSQGPARDFGDEVADEYTRTYGHGKACLNLPVDDGVPSGTALPQAPKPIQIWGTWGSFNNRAESK